MTETMPAHDALVLAGGEGRRLGGVDKAQVVVGGQTMLDRVLASTAGARRVVVVGPGHLSRPGVETVMEDPPGGGPVAGIDAGLALLGTDDDVPVLVLACDVPLAAEAVPGLLAALDDEPRAEGVQLMGDQGHAQYLVAVYRRAPLARALQRRRDGGGVAGCSVRRMVADLDLVTIPDPTGAGRDVDTWDDVAEIEDVIARRAQQ